MVNITPLGNKVFVQPEQQQEKTAGGLIIPAVINKDLEEGIVISVGESVINIPVGSRILYSSRTGTALMHEQKHYKFLNGPTANDPGEIIAII